MISVLDINQIKLLSAIERIRDPTRSDLLRRQTPHTRTILILSTKVSIVFQVMKNTTQIDHAHLRETSQHSED